MKKAIIILALTIPLVGCQLIRSAENKVHDILSTSIDVSQNVTTNALNHVSPSATTLVK